MQISHSDVLYQISFSNDNWLFSCLGIDCQTLDVCNSAKKANNPILASVFNVKVEIGFFPNPMKMMSLIIINL
jgi:hypothetical protein